ncbi:uncharacterized protein TM35_000182050 [Trypanosoma theileri]|uniref:Uncharacterized protein n=1 Tax=Trypanosoma theileri TaxID=67003 RepID=A0A1X0NUD1_9TRYP|nr:uncharacterized protein TM35_000182050 [Trypanosoma theileri]ORC88148.1 hypothetical protein TM35_000182050 [Trypanosoma theileri]
MRRWLFGRNPSFNTIAFTMSQLRRKTLTTTTTTTTTTRKTSSSSPSSSSSSSYSSAAVSATRQTTINIPHISAQRRIREIMVRQVLLSSQPLTITALVDLVYREYMGTKDLCGNSKPSHQPNTSDTTIAVSNHIVYLHDFLLSTAKKEEREDNVNHANSHEEKHYASQVEGTVRLILALDSQFRVSPAGYVCYPNLPSLLVSTSNLDHNETWVRTTRRLVHIEEAKHSADVNSAVNKKKGNVTSRWSYMLSLWYLLDSVMDSDNAFFLGKETNRRNISTNVVGNERDISLSQHLVELWVNTFDARDIPVLLRSDKTSSSSNVSSTRTDTKFHTPLELHACDEGNDYLRRWCTEAKEGYVGTALLGAPLLTQSTSTLLQVVNEQLGYLFTVIIATPITIAQLAALLQWSSLPFAAHYRSLLHFLLIYTGNPAVVRMEKHEMRRRETQRRWVELLRAKRIRSSNDDPHNYNYNSGRPRSSRTHGMDRRSRTGRYASRECVEEEINIKETSSNITVVGSGSSDVNNNNNNNNNNNSLHNTSDEVKGTTREVSAEQYGWWWQSSDGSSVNPKITNVCRCIFMQPNEMKPLDVNNRTPSEIMEDFDETENKKKKREEEEEGKKNTANNIVVFCAAPYVFERRICRIMRSWWAFEGQYTMNTKTHAVSSTTSTNTNTTNTVDTVDSLSNAGVGEKTIVITIRRLCQLCLWEHEYGSPAASKMMLHYLKVVTRGDNVVQLIPPSSSSLKGEDDAGNWLVLLRNAREEGNSAKTLGGGNIVNPL